MNKLIIAGMTASGLLGYNIKEDGTKVEQALENVQYIKSWVIEDLNSGVMDTIYAEYYINTLNETEELLINTK